MKIGIVGLGLIGGTYARSLRKYPYEIVGIDINEKALKYALENDIIDRGTNTPKDVLNELDVVFLCLYPKDTIKFIQTNINHFKKGAIISDAVGIKRRLIDALDIYFDDDVEFVFAHPIAGRETTGVEHSDQSIFKDANFIITPTLKNTDEALNLIETLAKQMGFKNVSRLTDIQHDEIIGFTSQLTHAIALALINSDDQAYDTKLFIGDSYKDLTRIAKFNDSLWAELFINNKDYLVKHINKFEKQLDLFKEALANKDIQKLQELMQEATLRRRQIE